VLVAFSTAGGDRELLRTVERANRIGMVTWAFTGPAPNPLAEACDEALACPGASAATVQEAHLVAIHLLCGAIDRCARRLEPEAVAR
jgi:phosphoheptose isomerase